MLQSMGSHRVGYNLATAQQQASAPGDEGRVRWDGRGKLSFKLDGLDLCPKEVRGFCDLHEGCSGPAGRGGSERLSRAGTGEKGSGVRLSCSPWMQSSAIRELGA